LWTFLEAWLKIRLEVWFLDAFVAFGFMVRASRLIAVLRSEQAAEIMDKQQRIRSKLAAL
jgi:hypothetical protein